MSTEARHSQVPIWESTRTDLSRKQANRIFVAILMTHTLLWVIVPILTQPNVPLDALEMITWGHEWELGYYKHPPLPAWLAEIASIVTGNSVWPTYVLAQLSTAACFLAVFVIGRQALGNRVALLAVLLLEACYYYNFSTPEFNNNVTSRGFCALSVLFLHQGLFKHKLRYWIFAGIALGLGMLSKYDTAIFALAMVSFSIIHPRGRAAWKTPGPIALLLSAMLCFLPHLIWLVSNDYPTITYFLKRSGKEKIWWDRFVNPLRFTASQLGAIVPMLLLAIPLTGWKWHKLKTADDEKSFHRDFLLWFGLGPFILVLIVALLTGAQIQSMWGTALWTFTGLALLSAVQIRVTKESTRRMAGLCVSVGMLFVVVLVIRNSAFPHIRGKASRVHFPGQQLAREVRKMYVDQVGETPHVIAGSWWEAANVATYGGERAHVYVNLDEEISPWMSDEKLLESGGVLVWQRTEYNLKTYESQLHRRFPTARVQPPLTLNWDTSADLDPITFHIAIIDPASKSQLGNRVSDAASDVTR